MRLRFSASTVVAAASLLLGSGVAAQDLASTTAAMGAAASIGTGMGNQARHVLRAARRAGTTETRGLVVEEAHGPGRGVAGRRGGVSRASTGGGRTEGDVDPRDARFYIDDWDDQPGVEFGGPPPELYQVRKGDTLWDLCGRFVGDPWAWPRVWSMNPSITNPHWIFPGDTIRFGEGGGTPTAAPRKRKGPRLSVSRAGPRMGGTLLLRTNGFVGDAELKGASRIVGSREEKEMLSAYDQAYIEFPAGRPLKVGERYTVYKPKNALKHPVGGGVVGHVVEIMGEVRIEQITDGNIARGVILEALNPIERGYRVGPLVRRVKPVRRRQNRVQLEAYILGMIRIGMLIGATELVFIDKGRRDGVEEGNLFYVIRRGDGYRPVAEQVAEQDPRYPKEVVAEVVVVDVRDHTSLGYIQRSSKETRRGDRLEMRKGY